jgi:hypothetical protein
MSRSRQPDYQLRETDFVGQPSMVVTVVHLKRQKQSTRSFSLFFTTRKAASAAAMNAKHPVTRVIVSVPLLFVW